MLNPSDVLAQRLCTDLVAELCYADGFERDDTSGPRDAQRQLVKTIQYNVARIVNRLTSMTEDRMRAELLDRLERRNPILYSLVRYAYMLYNGQVMRQLNELTRLRKELGLQPEDALPTPAQVQEETARLQAARPPASAEELRAQLSRRVQVDVAASVSPSLGQEDGV